MIARAVGMSSCQFLDFNHIHLSELQWAWMFRVHRWYHRPVVRHLCGVTKNQACEPLRCERHHEAGLMAACGYASKTLLHFHGFSLGIFHPSAYPQNPPLLLSLSELVTMLFSDYMLNQLLAVPSLESSPSAHIRDMNYFLIFFRFLLDHYVA